MRESAIDRRNPYQGKTRFLWGVGKPVADAGTMYLGFSKVGKFGIGFIADSEGWFLRSDNILTEESADLLHLPGDTSIGSTITTGTAMKDAIRRGCLAGSSGARPPAR